VDFPYMPETLVETKVDERINRVPINPLVEFQPEF